MATMTLNTAWSPAIVVGNNDKRRLISTIIITAANSFKDCTVVQMPNILASCAMPSFRTLVKPTSGAAATTSAYVTILHRSYVCPSPSSSVSTHLLGHTSETRSKCNIYRWKSALGPCSGHIYASKVRVIGSAYCKNIQDFLLFRIPVPTSARPKQRSVVPGTYHLCRHTHQHRSSSPPRRTAYPLGPPTHFARGVLRTFLYSGSQDAKSSMNLRGSSLPVRATAPRR